MPKDRIQPLELASINSGTIAAATFKPINTGFDGPVSIIRIYNAASEAAIVSYDGTTDNDFLAAGDVIQVNLQTNNRPANEVALLPKNGKVYVRGTAGIGFIYLSGWYNS